MILAAGSLLALTRRRDTPKFTPSQGRKKRHQLPHQEIVADQDDTAQLNHSPCALPSTVLLLYNLTLDKFYSLAVALSVFSLIHENQICATCHISRLKLVKKKELLYFII